MNSDGSAAEPHPAYRVRRLPDAKTWRGARRQYEVACFHAGATEPTWVRAARHPGSVLAEAGVHTTDIPDYLASADKAWNGAVGPWCSPYPGENE